MALLKRREPASMRIAVPRALLEYQRSGAAPLSGRPAGESQRIAVLVPQYRRGS
jgi:hypothetical protein